MTRDERAFLRQAVALAAKGIHPEAAAKVLGLSRNAFINRLRARGLDYLRRYEVGSPLTGETIDELVARGVIGPLDAADDPDAADAALADDDELAEVA